MLRLLLPWTLWLLLLSSRLSRAVSDETGGEVECRTGACLAAAFAGPAVSLIWLLDNITLSRADWDAMARPYVVRARNLTVSGRLDASRPVVDFQGIGPLVQLLPGAVCTWRHLSWVRWRPGVVQQAPGMQLITYTPPAAAPDPTATSVAAATAAGAALPPPAPPQLATAPASPPEPPPPLMVLQDCVVVWSLCSPYLEMRRANMASLQRPANMAGPNRMYQPVVWPPGCGAGRAAGDFDVVPASEEPLTLTPQAVLGGCWNISQVMTDWASQAYDIDSAGRAVLAKYQVQILDSYGLCSSFAPPDCVDRLGLIGCQKLMASKIAAAANTTHTNATVAPPPLEASGNGGSGSSQQGQLSGGAVAGVAVGVAIAVLLMLVLAAGVGAVWLKRRRQRRHQMQKLNQSESSADCEAASSTAAGNDASKGPGGGGGGLVHAAAAAAAAADCGVSGDGGGGVVVITHAAPHRPDFVFGVQLLMLRPPQPPQQPTPTPSAPQQQPAQQPEPGPEPAPPLALPAAQQQPPPAAAGPGGCSPQQGFEDSTAPQCPAAAAPDVAPDEINTQQQQFGGASAAAAAAATAAAATAAAAAGDQQEQQQQRMVVVSARVAAASRPGSAAAAQPDPGYESAASEALAAAGLDTGRTVVLLPTLLGRGAFGRVQLGLFRGQRVAVKVIGDAWAFHDAAAIPRQQQQGAASPALAASALPFLTSTSTLSSCLMPPLPSQQPTAAADVRAERMAAANTVSAAAPSSSSSSSGLAPPNNPAKPTAGRAAACGAKAAAGDVGGAGGGGGGRDHDNHTNNDAAGEQPPPVDRLVASLGYEVDILARSAHPHIVTLLAASLTPPNACLVLELMETNLDALLYGPPASSCGAAAAAQPQPAADAAAAAAAAGDAAAGDAAEGGGAAAAAGPSHAASPNAAPHRTLLPLATVLRIAIQVAAALEYMHPTVVHRDIKPANVLINAPHSPSPVVKVSDFGLSRINAATATLATLHPEAGTPAYLAPECYDPANTRVHHRADIYSLGVLLWAMLTGRRPWEGFAVAAVAFKVTVLGERLPLQQLSSCRCPDALKRLIWQCWEADPHRRPAAAELAKGLQVLLMELEARREGESSTATCGGGGGGSGGAQLDGTSASGGGGGEAGGPCDGSALAALELELGTDDKMISLTRCIGQGHIHC